MVPFCRETICIALPVSAVMLAAMHEVPPWSVLDLVLFNVINDLDVKSNSFLIDCTDETELWRLANAWEGRIRNQKDSW